MRFSSWFLLLSLAVCGCGSDDGMSEGAKPNPIDSLPDGWNAITPGGAPACSDASPYSFYVRRGSVDRVVVEFSGGGACWNATTCAFASSLFEKTVDPTALPWLASPPPGIYDHDRPDNPFRDWHHVFVPYCTGDIHWGDNVADYGNGLTIHHVGATNTRAVLDWVYQNVLHADRITLTGCSAGGYAAILWTPWVAQHYGPGTPVSQLADSAAGTITASFFAEIEKSWKFRSSIPSFVPGLEAGKSVSNLSTLYDAIGAAYPDLPLSQYNTAYDETQSKYFALLGGGNADTWSALMREEIKGIRAATPSFHYLIAPGSQHCILTRNELYEASFGGKKLADWISAQREGELVEDFDCGSDCGSPE